MITAIIRITSLAFFGSGPSPLRLLLRRMLLIVVSWLSLLLIIVTVIIFLLRVDAVLVAGLFGSFRVHLRLDKVVGARLASRILLLLGLPISQLCVALVYHAAHSTTIILRFKLTVVLL